MDKRWKLREMEKPASARTGQHVLLHPLVAAILAARGFENEDDVRSFLSPLLSEMIDPQLLRGMPAAVERLLLARRNRETVCIYGDYDVDGITGTSLLVSFLRSTGFTCIYFIPNRFDDGYGINAESIERIIALGATLIVSVDCGITAVDEAVLCRTRGIDLIIVDHHAPKEVIPDACAVLNPLQPGCHYPFKSLAGVGVAFNLLVALRSALRDAGAFTDSTVPDLREWLDLVALGTIADVVPLVGQNRMYAFHGLKQLSSSMKPGIMALKRVAGITDAVTCGQVGFRLAPRLNAAGRMESAVPGVDLLLSDDSEECQLIAADLDSANAERQAIERRIFDEAEAMIHTADNAVVRRSIVLASAEWHQGVVGIVASRLVERYHRPTILIALTEDGLGKGSGRSIPGFHLLDALSACSQHLERFGGHRYAAGVGLRAEKVAAFAESFEAEAARMLTDADLTPTLDIDAEVHPADITKELALELKRLEPFGAGNPEPVLMMRGMTVVERRVVGEGHMRLRLTGENRSFIAIAFRMAEREIPGQIDIAFFPEINEWKGSSSVQLRIKDLRPAE
ncbi:MAG: single-stranded-DNA-specific exonuclease RecJ [Verrucomicrobia bacterium]|nr:single-stranded-DNA-specific exonuclease RecJ [Deltaproteobacteria bacterium]